MINLYGNESAKRLIPSMIRSGRLAHSFLICGERGIGKKTLAKYMTMQLLCESDGEIPCMQCRSCRNIMRDIHPDVIFPPRSGKTMIYGTEAAEFTLSSSIILPNNGERKVYIFSDTDSMNEIAQNKLLKVIEEPPEFVFFIFTAENRSSLLPTVLSRLVSVGMSECSREDTLSALSEMGFSDEQCREGYDSFGGNIGLCAEYLSGGQLKAAVDIARQVTDGIISKNEYMILFSLSETESDRGLYRLVLRQLMQIIRDAAVGAFSENNFCGCYHDGASRLTSCMTPRRAEKIYRLLCKAEREQDSNVIISLSQAALTAGIMSV